MCDPVSLGATALGVSALASGYSAYSSGKQAEEYAGVTKKLSNTQAAISKAQWDRYMGTFAPVENKVVGEVSKPLENQSYFQTMMANIDKGYSDLSANVAKKTAAMYPNGGGVADIRQHTLDLARVRDKAKATATAENSRLNNMMAVAGLGRNLPAQAQSGYQSAAGTNASLANMYANASNTGWNSLGNTAGNLTQLYMMNKMMNPQQPSIGGAGTYNGVYDPAQAWA